MRKLLIGIAIGLLFCSPLRLWAASVKLDLSALSPTIQQDLLKQFPVLTSQIRQSDLDQVIRYLVIQEQFDSAQVFTETLGEQTIYRIVVSKTRRISQLKFNGMDAVSESEVRREFSIGEKSIFDQQTLIEAGERVRRTYRDRGYQNTVIDLEFERQSTTDVAVTVKIKEGPQTKIADVDLKTRNLKLKENLERFLAKEMEGEALTDSLLSKIKNEVRERLSSMRYYKASLEGPEINLNSDESQARLLFTVNNSEEYFIDYVGLLAKSRGQIEKKLELDKFFSSNPQIGPELASKIKNLYLEDGYPRVDVSSEQVPGSYSDQTKIIIKINEGPRVRINEVNFTGHFSEREKYYQDFVEDHSSSLISKGWYNRESFEVGLKNLIIDRQNKGFLKAKIISVKTAYQGEKKDKISITVNLEEGPLTILNKLSFEGITAFSPEELLDLVELKANEPLQLNKLDEALIKLKEHYRNNGYLEMYIANEKQDLVSYNDDSSKAQVNFRIFEGPKVIVSSILIEGNNITKDYVILKEIEFSVGDTLTPSKLDESIARLQRLGHFATVDIRMLEEKTQISERTVIIRVQDRDPGVFNLGVGANNERQLTLRGYAGIAYRNLMGNGHGVSLRVEGNYNIADIKYLERKVVVGYLWPYLFDTRLKGRGTYTQSTFVSDSDKLEATEVKQTTYSIEQDITSHILFSYDLWSYAFLRKFAINPSRNAFDTTELGIATTGPTIDIDYRDHPFNPTSGTRTILNMEYGSPALGSSETIEFARYFGSFTHYLPMGGAGWVWANSLRGGFLENLSKRSDGGVPYDVKGFSLGGQSSIRGFTLGEIFPGQTELRDENGLAVKPTDFKLKDSATMYLIKSELRFPISGAFGGATFYDGGAVFVKNQGFEDPYRDAAGFALRYETPVGAASLEFGYKLDRKNDESAGQRREDPWAIHFSIGTF